MATLSSLSLSVSHVQPSALVTVSSSLVIVYFQTGSHRTKAGLQRGPPDPPTSVFQVNDLFHFLSGPEVGLGLHAYQASALPLCWHAWSQAVKRIH